MPASTAKQICLYCRSNALHDTSIDDVPNCMETAIAGTMYTFCTNPVKLTDSLLGPARFQETVNSSYYRWNKDTTYQILFTFPMNVSVTTLSLSFYIARDSGIGLPKTRLSLVGENFGVADTLNEVTTQSLTIDPVTGDEGSNELRTLTRNLTSLFRAMTSQILLRIEDDKVYALALTEIKFCAGKIEQPP